MHSKLHDFNVWVLIQRSGDLWDALIPQLGWATCGETAEAALAAAIEGAVVLCLDDHTQGLDPLERMREGDEYLGEIERIQLTGSPISTDEALQGLAAFVTQLHLRLATMELGELRPRDEGTERKARPLPVAWAA